MESLQKQLRLINIEGPLLKKVSHLLYMSYKNCLCYLNITRLVACVSDRKKP